MDPLRIYVLWHPDCSVGRDYAASLYRWFRGDPSLPAEIGHGIPVHYRSVPENGKSAKPRPIQPQAAELNVLVPLVDEHLVVDPSWRAYLRDLTQITKALLVPVALHRAAYQLPGEINRLNFLRLDRVTDPDSWTREQRLEVRRQRLLSLLTQVVGRLLTGFQEAAATGQTSHPGAGPTTEPIPWLERPTPPIRVFISHAKADGVPIAEALRHTILQHGQLQAFFDESDLAIGYGFASTLERGAGFGTALAEGGTAAMIAVYTDAYAHRPWCQRELRLARIPEPIAPREGGVPCWRAKPLVVVEALQQGNTRFLPEAGYAPLLTWQPKEVGTLIDRLLRELLFFSFNQMRAQRLPQAKDGGRHALNCPPDLHLLRYLKCRDPKLTEVAVPPPGPAGEDRTALEDLAGGIRIRTFHEIEVDPS